MWCSHLVATFVDRRVDRIQSCRRHQKETEHMGGLCWCCVVRNAVPTDSQQLEGKTEGKQSREETKKKERRSNRVHVVRADCRIDSSTTRHTHTTTSRHPSIHSSIHPSIHPSRNNRIYSVGYSGETDSAFGACGRADNVVATVIESVATRRLDEQPWCCLSRQRSAGRSR